MAVPWVTLPRLLQKVGFPGWCVLESAPVMISFWACLSFCSGEKPVTAWRSQTKGLEHIGPLDVLHVHLQIHFLLSHPAQCWRRLISAILQQAPFSIGWLVGQWRCVGSGEDGVMASIPCAPPFPSLLLCHAVGSGLRPSMRPQLPPCSLLPTTASSMLLPCKSGVVTAPILASLRFLSHPLLISLHPALTSVHSLFINLGNWKVTSLSFWDPGGSINLDEKKVLPGGPVNLSLASTLRERNRPKATLSSSL